MVLKVIGKWVNYFNNNNQTEIHPSPETVYDEHLHNLGQVNSSSTFTTRSWITQRIVNQDKSRPENEREI